MRTHNLNAGAQLINSNKVHIIFRLNLILIQLKHIILITNSQVNVHSVRVYFAFFFI